MYYTLPKGGTHNESPTTQNLPASAVLTHSRALALRVLRGASAAEKVVHERGGVAEGHSERGKRAIRNAI